jgi:hypothetical protein
MNTGNGAFGGGWTRFGRVRGGECSGASIKGIECEREFTQVGGQCWVFHGPSMQKSKLQLLMYEPQGSNRIQWVDFRPAIAAGGEQKFVDAVTGDYGLNPNWYDWNTGSWRTGQGGPCNNNDHSQFNCEPEVGVRMHYGSHSIAHFI